MLKSPVISNLIVQVERPTIQDSIPLPPTPSTEYLDGILGWIAHDELDLSDQITNLPVLEILLNMYPIELIIESIANLAYYSPHSYRSPDNPFYALYIEEFDLIFKRYQDELNQLLNNPLNNSQRLTMLISVIGMIEKMHNNCYGCIGNRQEMIDDLKIKCCIYQLNNLTDITIRSRL